MMQGERSNTVCHKELKVMYFYLFVNVIVHITQAVGGNPAPSEHRASKNRKP